ncbi:MAG: hypothetical protein KQH53_08350 [Desulfarculaceae bacterium]|nr:hypothetical protein [Desulfarculaceae bacterium]
MAQVAEKKLEIFLESEGVAPAPLSRVWGAVIWPGNTKGYALVGAQEKTSKRVHLLAEAAERDWEKLTRRMVDLGKGFKVSRWLQESGSVGDSFRNFANRLCREEMLTKPTGWGGFETLPLQPAPQQDAPQIALGLAMGFIKGGQLVSGPGLELFEKHLRVAAGMSYQEVGEAMVESLFAFHALVFLISAFHTWQVQPAREERPIDRTRDSLTGV